MGLDEIIQEISIVEQNKISEDWVLIESKI